MRLRVSILTTGERPSALVVIADAGSTVADLQGLIAKEHSAVYGAAAGISLARLEDSKNFALPPGARLDAVGLVDDAAVTAHVAAPDPDGQQAGTNRLSASMAHLRATEASIDGLNSAFRSIVTEASALLLAKSLDGGGGAAFDIVLAACCSRDADALSTAANLMHGLATAGASTFPESSSPELHFACEALVRKSGGVAATEAACLFLQDGYLDAARFIAVGGASSAASALVAAAALGPHGTRAGRAAATLCTLLAKLPSGRSALLSRVAITDWPRLHAAAGGVAAAAPLLALLLDSEGRDATEAPSQAVAPASPASSLVQLASSADAAARAIAATALVAAVDAGTPDASLAWACARGTVGSPECAAGVRAVSVLCSAAGCMDLGAVVEGDGLPLLARIIATQPGAVAGAGAGHAAAARRHAAAAVAAAAAEGAVAARAVALSPASGTGGLIAALARGVVAHESDDSDPLLSRACLKALIAIATGAPAAKARIAAALPPGALDAGEGRDPLNAVFAGALQQLLAGR